MPGIKKKLGVKLGYAAQLVICDFCSGHLYVVVWQFGPYEKNMFLAIKTCIFNLFRTIKKEKYPKSRAGSDGAFRNCVKLKMRELFIKNPRK